MISILIPYFLTASYVVNDSKWQYGPEYKFAYNVNMELENVDNKTHMRYGLNFTYHLFCRPKDFDILSCYVDTLKLTQFEHNLLENITTTEDYNGSANYSLNNIRFDVKYKHGIEEVILPEHIHNTIKVNAIKYLSNLLNLQNLLNITDGKLQQMHNFLLGECVTEFNFEKKYSNDNVEEDHEHFKLQLFNLNETSKYKIQLNKYVNLNNCNRIMNFSFLSLIIIELDENDSWPVIMQSYVSNAYISETKFVSTIQAKSSKHHVTEDRILYITEDHLLTLLEINPAQQ